jgi:hypothetical protein
MAKVGNSGGGTMKKLYPIIFLCLVSVSGCQSSIAHQQGKTQFFDNFSLYNTVNRINPPPIRCSQTFSTGTSGGGAAGTFSYRKDSTLECGITDPRFDANAFTDQLRGEIEREITSSGPRVTGVGRNGENFHFDYNDGSIRGAIELVAGRVEANKYRMTYIIREHS